MEQELVSILIPVYNRVDLVSKTIDSAINQTYKNTEIIIVDNCSTDGTWKLLLQYALKDNRIHIFRNHENIGPVRNWKRCLDEAKGTFSKILFSDDLMSENFIEETLKQFDENTAFVISTVKIIGESCDKVLGNYENINIFTTKRYFKNILVYDHYGFPVSPVS